MKAICRNCVFADKVKELDAKLFEKAAQYRAIMAQKIPRAERQKQVADAKLSFLEEIKDATAVQLKAYEGSDAEFISCDSEDQLKAESEKDKKQYKGLIYKYYFTCPFFKAVEE